MLNMAQIASATSGATPTCATPPKAPPLRISRSPPTRPGRTRTAKSRNAPNGTGWCVRPEVAQLIVSLSDSDETGGSSRRSLGTHARPAMARVELS